MRFFFTVILLLGTIFNASSSTINWRIYTSDGKYSMALSKTVWASERDGERIRFGREDGEGSFEPGGAFSYSPKIGNVNGFTVADEYPRTMLIYLNGKHTNTLKLVMIEGSFFLVDKRGIRYGNSKYHT